MALTISAKNLATIVTASRLWETVGPASESLLKAGFSFAGCAGEFG